MSESAPPAAFDRFGPERPRSPVILSVPHAGRDYRPELLGACRLPLAMLETLEDRLVDRLIWRATEAGAAAFVARAPRAEIDLNRDEREIDPSLIAPPLPSGSILQSVRSRGGIGLIPSRIAGVGAIWRERVPREELVRRILHIHRPYHQALEQALAETRDRFGVAVLLDCHSMPPRADGSQGQVIFGDRYGSSAGAHLVEAAVAASRALGYRTACNAPYAGGYIAGRHGRPDRGIHAIQIEIDRSAYLDAELRAPGPGFAEACRLIGTVVEAIEARLFDDRAIAAE
ncbi:N-formylglutamate amidohydrolase [Sphingosinicella terrae]|uniref:N-formylglutamate amidohydrolase n=1 Tax=Sphingosinicella terrae TaxID=2172047 RepID=UPI000E0DB7E1|nr:N-formylglutamate amidohydrolase [Sphingosinicella terrae]